MADLQTEGVDMRIRATGAVIAALLSAAAAAGAQPPGSVDAEPPPDSLSVPADSLAQEPPALPAEDVPTVPPAVDPTDPSSVITAYFEALGTGDSAVVLAYTSSEALASVAVMLDGLQESLDRDEAGTMGRMSAAGYAATAAEIEDWEPADYLAAAVVLPMMRNRYTVYDLQVGVVEVDDDEAEAALTFVTASGAGIPFPALLAREDDVWKVSTFLGLNTFP